MGRFARSWQLAKTSGSVLRSDKELVLLPVFSALASLLVMATFAAPAWFTLDRTTDAAGNSELGPTPVSYVILFLVYLVLAYVTIFFNAALISAADERLRGGDPSVGSALRGASSRAGAILPWAIVSATVSVILRAIQERAGFVGQIVAGLAGMAWAVVTFLVLPIIVFERLGVGAAIKRSAELFKKTWGENLIGNGGIGLVSFLAVLAGTPVLLLLAVPATAVKVAGVALFVLWVLAVAAVTAALTGIYSVALYRFACEGQAPAAFAQADLAGAFEPKRNRRRSWA